MLNCLRLSFIFIAISTLTACAQVNPHVPLQQDFWMNCHQKVAVINTQPSKPDLYQKGREGLLDYAINNAVTGSFQEHLHQVNLSWYDHIPQEFAQQLKHNGLRNVKAYSGYIDPTPNGQAGFAVQSNSDKLLIIKLKAIGATRMYYGFIPMGPPQAYCSMTGELIDTQTQKILWHDDVTNEYTVEGSWDEPPNYPVFDAELQKAIDDSKAELMRDFFTNH